MTIGDKIRYYREQLGITQGKLAELSGIHPVSIRKYETNKMQPQPTQIEKIANALGISYNALNGIDNAGIRLETVGDLMGVLMVLCNSHIIQITGERGENHMLKGDTVTVQFNPVLTSYLEMNYISQGKRHSLSLQNILINIKNDHVFESLLQWEKLNFLYETFSYSNGNQINDSEKAILNQMQEQKERIELELQKSQSSLISPPIPSQ